MVRFRASITVTTVRYPPIEKQKLKLPTHLIILPDFWAKITKISHPINNYPYLKHCTLLVFEVRASAISYYTVYYGLVRSRFPALGRRMKKRKMTAYSGNKRLEGMDDN